MVFHEFRDDRFRLIVCLNKNKKSNNFKHNRLNNKIISLPKKWSI